jgi:large subunit ribosomal protein L22
MNDKNVMGFAQLNNYRISPRKARLVIDLVRGHKVNEAIRLLRFTNKKSAPVIEKLMLSAVSNASQKFETDIDDLFVVEATVDMGRTLKRFMPRAQGRATPIRKRSARIKISVGYRV